MTHNYKLYNHSREFVRLGLQCFYSIIAHGTTVFHRVRVGLIAPIGRNSLAGGIGSVTRQLLGLLYRLVLFSIFSAYSFVHRRLFDFSRSTSLLLIN